MSTLRHEVFLKDGSKGAKKKLLTIGKKASWSKKS
jgi:hypothetical protein